MTLAGTPATRVFGGTSCVTTLPAATTAFSPISTPHSIMEFPASHALSLIITGASLLGKRLTLGESKTNEPGS